MRLRDILIGPLAIAALSGVVVSRAAQELCPAMIWQLRQSAAHYQPPPGT